MYGYVATAGTSQSRYYLFRNWSPERRTRWIAVSTRICIPCLSQRSVGGKNTAISLCSVQRARRGRGSARAARISYSPVRPANTIICRFKRDALFSVPLFSNFTSAPCFFLNRKWDTSDEKLTKIWPTPMENSGFCDRICRIPRSLYRKFY